MRSAASSRRLADLSLAAVAAAGGLVACSPSSGSGGAPAGASQAATYTIWDPYPQHDKGSEWVELLETCGTQAGVTVERAAYDTSDLTHGALLAARQGNAPDVLMVGKPVVSTLAEVGVLTTTDEKLDTSAIAPNLLAAGQNQGKTYGVPIGANTLALMEGYRAVLDQQLPYLGTSLLVGLGTVALTLALAAPAGYSLAKLRPRGGGALSFVLLIAQMIPGIIMAMGFYAIYLNARHAQHRRRA